MHRDSPAARWPWTLVLVLAMGAVVVNFAGQPLGGAVQIPAIGRPLTLWVADARADTQSALIARQAAGYWPPSRAGTTVGLLPGPPAFAVEAFLSRTAAGGDLLVLTTTTLSDIAQPSPGSDGLGASRPLADIRRAQAVAVLASDPLQIVVRAQSSLRLSQLLRHLRSNRGRRVLGLAHNRWVNDNLAALVLGAKVSGRIPYTAFATSQDALSGLLDGQADAVVVPSSVARYALAAGRVRDLGWPGGHAPRAWVALAAPRGLAPRIVASLRAQAASLIRSPAWRRLIVSEGLRPVAATPLMLRSFLGAGTATAARLAARAARVIVN